jgi:hypothetical protein
MNPQVDAPLTVQDAGDRLGFSSDTARRMFEDEPGVIKLGLPSRKVGRKYRRRYFTIRIPLAVFERVRDRLQQKGPA